MKNFYKNYSKKNSRLKNALKASTRKQKTATVVCIVSFLFVFNNLLFAQQGGGNIQMQALEVILGYEYDENYKIAFLTSFSWIDIFLKAVDYIAQSQISTVDTIASTPLGSKGMFSSVINMLTIFASIGCAYRIVNHFFKTEKYDNVQSFLGFFSYIPILVLFLFSDSIVNFMVSSNTNINSEAVSNISQTIISGVSDEIKSDFEAFAKKEVALDEEYEAMKSYDLGGIMSNRLSSIKNTSSYTFMSYIKYIYYAIFGAILTTVLAIPTVIMTLMVKILLTIAILGAKIVFLLAFIPGFENSWKTYMLNILNVLLWIPIFNVIIAFILGIIDATIVANTLNTGQIVWLSVVAIICSYQAISLTTSAAQMIVNGAGAGMAGALGSMAAMNATSMIVGAAGATVAAGTMVATKGASAAKGISSKMPSKE